ncbi:hypothetical protein [Agaribacterium haliotis]|uniref:hypothetical protein n=1 Tax=Agaribacterium haliotis TaxID=2013869 RepID=UPI000BB53460|nr:hypothetical protein [Agaribacterium haliotis]
MSVKLTKSFRPVLALLCLSASTSLMAASKTYTPPLKNGFPIAEETAAQFCKEKNSAYTEYTINSKSTAVDQSVAIRISNTWALSFPTQVEVKVNKLTCKEPAGPAPKTYSYPRANGAVLIMGLPEQAAYFCASEGYPARYSSYKSVSAPYETQYTGWAYKSSATGSWQYYAPTQYGPPVLSEVSCY